MIVMDLIGTLNSFNAGFINHCQIMMTRERMRM